MTVGRWILGQAYVKSVWGNTESVLPSLCSTAEHLLHLLYSSLICSALDQTSLFLSLKSTRNVNALPPPAHTACFLLSTMHLSHLCLERPSIFLKAKLSDSFPVKTPLPLQVHLPHFQLDHSGVLSLTMSSLVFGWG